jgi:hypothetical protein
MSLQADRSHRLAILTASEIDDLFGLPRFTEEDRQLYFDLSPVEQEAAAAYNFPVGGAFRAAAWILQSPATILCL